MNSAYAEWARGDRGATGAVYPLSFIRVKFTRYRRLVQEATRRTGAATMQSDRRDNCYAPQFARASRARWTHAEIVLDPGAELFAPAPQYRIPRAAQAVPVDW